jgi:hypothetical protein
MDEWAAQALQPSHQERGFLVTGGANRVGKGRSRALPGLTVVAMKRIFVSLAVQRFTQKMDKQTHGGLLMETRAVIDATPSC